MPHVPSDMVEPPFPFTPAEAVMTYVDTVEPYPPMLSCWKSSSEWLGQAGKLGREKPDEVQQGQVQGPAPGEEQPHTSVQAWGWPTGEQPCGEGPGCPSGRQVNHEPAVWPGCQDALGGAWPAGWWRFSFPSTLPSSDLIWSTLSSSGLPTSRKMRS